MESTGYKIFNDSVHGHITLHPLLVQVVDTPEFQRLRNIKQLGVANYVFPGAGHCRFEHSLGTCYLAGQMVDKLLARDRARGRTEEEEKKLSLCVQLAALCHDLGHGPFSHTWEAVIKAIGKTWRHEEASVKMFDHLIKRNKLKSKFNDEGLEKGERNIIKELIMGGPSAGEEPLLPPRDHFLYEIVSNKSTGIDVDKWDYFLRDGLHLNLRITFDYRRLLEFCTVLPTVDDDADEGVKTHIAFRDKEMMNLYDMYRVRSALHHTAYRHKVVIGIELMYIDAFRAACNAGYCINNSDVFLSEIHQSPETMSQVTDHVFFDILYSRDRQLETAQTLFRRTLQRKLYTFVCKVNVQVPVEKKQEHIENEKLRLEDLLNSQCHPLEFRVGVFYLDLDLHNDPVSKVTFYKKVRSSNKIQRESFKNIQDILDPFPFQLAKETTAQLLVFCKKAEATENDLRVARRVIKNWSQTNIQI